MRTKGAFLVSASCGSGTIGSVTVFSECGGEFRLKNPWSRAMDQENRIYDGERICIQMKKGEEIVLTSSAIENKQPNSSHR